MLQLNSTVWRVNATQTDLFGTDSKETGKHSVECQTLEGWNAQRGKISFCCLLSI